MFRLNFVSKINVEKNSSDLFDFEICATKSMYL